MNGHAYPDRPVPKAQAGSVAACLVLAALAVVAVLAVIAPTANAGQGPHDQGLVHLDRARASPTRGSAGPAASRSSRSSPATFERKLVLGTGRKAAARET